VQLSHGQRIFRVVGGAVFALILVILYAPFLIMGILSFAERTTAVFPPSDFSFIS
jgi:ABC-type spermidine/putrescine transport system permease subunit II